MSPPNGDNATARFLFAILKQKNLKDINWEQVAKDPVLLDPAPNGHAARMRYSRFKATVTGQQPSKRNRTPSGEKSRVSKPSKKESRMKSEDIIKSESVGINLSSLAQYSPATSMSPPYPGDGRDDFSARFLTPCSDDMTQSLPLSAAAASVAFLDQGSHDHPALPHSPSFSAFESAYDLSGFGVQGSQNGPDLGSSQALADYGHDWATRYPDQHPF